MKMNVRDMQRVPHRHVFGDRINGRDVCDECPYRAKRGRILSAFTDQDNEVIKVVRTNQERFERRYFRKTIPSMTVPELKALLLKQSPEFKGVSKMRKPELIQTLVGMVR